MVKIGQLAEYCHQLLDVAAFKDYCPNGLQVQGREQVEKLVCGVTASQAMIAAAAERGADALLVHHGYFWKGEDPCITGMKRRRLGLLMDNDISLLAYHLPLDAHPRLGNNAQLAALLGFQIGGQFADIAMHGQLPRPMAGKELAATLEQALSRPPLHIAGNQRPIETVAWCTGGAQSYLEHAVALGVDAFITGEASEQTFHSAMENGIHFFAAGHHATERYGVQSLARHLADTFDLEYEFVDIDNPV